MALPRHNASRIFAATSPAMIAKYGTSPQLPPKVIRKMSLEDYEAWWTELHLPRGVTIPANKKPLPYGEKNKTKRRRSGDDDGGDYEEDDGETVPEPDDPALTYLIQRRMIKNRISAAQSRRKHSIEVSRLSLAANRGVLLSLENSKLKDQLAALQEEMNEVLERLYSVEARERRLALENDKFRTRMMAPWPATFDEFEPSAPPLSPELATEPSSPEELEPNHVVTGVVQLLVEDRYFDGQ